MRRELERNYAKYSYRIINFTSDGNLEFIYSRGFSVEGVRKEIPNSKS